jgi:O-antigen/teichoic acid export membrane protein
VTFLPGSLNTGYSVMVKLGIILYSPTIIFTALINSANALFQTNHRYDLSAIASVVGSLCSFILVWAVIYMMLPTVAIIGGIAALDIGLCISAASALFLARRYMIWSPIKNLSEIKKLFIWGIPLGVTLICNVLYFRADSFILTLTRTTTEVGLYGFAYKIFEFILVIPTFFMNAVYPFLIKTNGTSRKTFLSLSLKSGLVLLIISVMATIGVWVASPLVTVVKPEFGGSIVALKILALGFPFFFLSSLTMWILVTLNKQILLLLIYVISMVVNIVSNIWFIPTFGCVAAAWITGISEMLVLILSLAVIYIPSTSNE